MNTIELSYRRATIPLVVGILLSLLFARLVWGWTNPTQAPPNGNLSLPSAQWTASGTAIYNSNSGNVGVGTSSPAALFSVATSSNIFNVLSNGNIGIGVSAPGARLHIKDASPSGARLRFEEASGEIATIGMMGVAGDGRLGILDDTDAEIVSFMTKNDSKRGYVGIGTANPSKPFEVYGNFASGNTVRNIAKFFADGNNIDARGLLLQLGADDAAGTNEAIEFLDGDGTSQGAISFSNGTITYGAFTANHDVRLRSKDGVAGYPYGTIVCVNSTYLKEGTERGIEYDVEECGEAYAPNMLGVYASKYANKANLHQVYVLGDGHILVNGQGGDIKVGDLITSSLEKGIGMKAASAGWTIGVAQANHRFSHQGEIKLIPVQYGLRYLHGRPDSSQNLAGITILDRVTKLPFCVFSENGVLKSSSGSCDE